MKNKCWGKIFNYHIINVYLRLTGLGLGFEDRHVGSVPLSPSLSLPERITETDGTLYPFNSQVSRHKATAVVGPCFGRNEFP